MAEIVEILTLLDHNKYGQTHMNLIFHLHEFQCTHWEIGANIVNRI